MKNTDNIESLLDKTIEGNGDISESNYKEQKLEINLVETEDTFIIEAPLPGVPLDNIHLALNGDTLTIEADYPEKKKKGETIYQEFTKERVSRSIVLPKTFEDGSEKAELENGLLTVHIKKRKNKGLHSIHIEERDE